MTIVLNNFFSVDLQCNSLGRRLGFLPTPVVYDDLPIMKIKIKHLKSHTSGCSFLPVRHFLYCGQHFVFHFLIHQKSLGADLLLRNVGGQRQDQSEEAGGDDEGGPPR